LPDPAQGMEAAVVVGFHVRAVRVVEVPPDGQHVQCPGHAEAVAPGHAEVHVELAQCRGQSTHVGPRHPYHALVLAAEHRGPGRDVADRHHAHAVDARPPDAGVHAVVRRSGFHGRPPDARSGLEASYLGTRMTNRAPPSGDFASSTSPPCARATRRRIASPRPKPTAPARAPALRKNGSKTRSRSSGWTPRPASSTASVTVPFAAATTTATRSP